MNEVVHAPAGTDEVIDAVAQARSEGTALEIRGGGSVLDRLPPHDAPVLDTSLLSGVVALATEDLTVTVRAGTPVAQLVAVLADHGQECPIEASAGAGSTVGGRIATGLAGPRQLGAGRVRDWLLRVRFVSGRAHQVTSGGVTVKDVTGFDLCRLLTGSWGTLGVLTEVTLKLRPIARTRTWFATSTPNPDLDRQLYRPAALLSSAARTHVLLEGHPDDVAAQAAEAGLVPAEPPPLPTTARAAVDPARLPALREAIERAGATAITQDAVGVCYLDGPAAALVAVRSAAEGLGGSLLLLDRASGSPAFGSAARPGAMERRVEKALDPDGVLAPWRWEQ